jgi:integrase
MAKRAKGEGTVCQRKDGRWQASLQVHGVRKTVYAKTEREARQKLAELRKQAALQGALPDPGKRTVGDLLDAWLEVNAPRWRPRTLQDWQYICRTHLRPALGRVRLDKLTPQRIHSLLAHLEHPRTALKVYRALHMACALAVRWGYLAQNPCDRVDPPRYRPPSKDIWTPQDLGRFLQGTEGHPLYPLWAFLLASGCRLGEALALTWQDIDWQAGTVTVSKSLQRVGGEWLLQPPKTKAGERTLALPPWGLAALKRQRAQQAQWRLQAGARWCNEWGLVFTGRDGSPLHQATVTCALRQACQRLGLPPLTPHGLRHLHASLLLDAGLSVPEVAARLGHANPVVTMSVYAHKVRKGDRAAAQALAQVVAHSP